MGTAQFVRYLMPLAYGAKLGLPDSEAQVRCRPLVNLARVLRKEKAPYFFVLGAGMPRKTEPHARSLAHAMLRYLLEEGFSKEQIVMNPRGYNTVTEICAVKEVLQHFPSGRIIAATSPWHAKRTTQVFSILLPDCFHYCITPGTTTLTGKTLRHAIWRERVGFLISYTEAWSVRLGFIKPWQTRRAFREGFVTNLVE